jgi:mannose-6-phosphate isomerase-like protein (cupin superfamily)
MHIVAVHEDSTMTSRRKLLRATLASLPVLLGASVGNATGPIEEHTERSDKWFWIPGHAFTMKAVGSDTGKACTWVLAENKPREGVVLHKHLREDECFYILDGRYEMTIGDRTVIGSSGSFFFGPRNVPHQWTNVGSTAGRLFFVYTPSGIEEFFLGVGMPIRNPGERPNFDPAELGKRQAEMAQRVGLTKLGEAKYRIRANGY